MNIIGFDIGGTKSAVLLAQIKPDGIVFFNRKEIATTSDWRYILNTLCGFARQMEQEYGVADVAGVSCGEPLSTDRKLICSPPNLPGWDEVPVIEYLEDKLGIPVSMENDADACALAEWRYGAGKGSNHIIFLTFGTGLGAGLILDGRLYRGSCGIAGEVGHIRMEADGPEGYGKRGSLEGFCSGGGIGRLALEYVEREKENGRIPAFAREEGVVLTARTVAEAAKKGDKDAQNIYRISGREFGRGLSILIDLLNPERIVVGSIYTRCGELLEESMYEEIRKEALLQSRNICRIIPAKLGEQIGDYGAIMAAVYQQPLLSSSFVL